MVRRAASNATDDSLKENSGVPSSQMSGKERGVKREKGLRNGQSSGRRVQSDDEDMQDADGTQGGRVDDQERAEDAEEDAEGDDQDEEDEEEEGRGSPKGRKRARANTNGDARPSGSDPKGKGKARQVTLPRDDDGFIPGSIVRVQLKNFVTYDYVEFSPGPYLNMILGPNGTGKSSIACAICLGLNFPPSVLGRAADLNSFVKLGTTDGHIEIELKGPKGKPNLVIKRTLKAHSKSSHFTINGESASGREVNAKMAELNVQVSNLCSFLPQDKVAEFARMSPQQLLKETQRAAGNEKLTSWHETLISSGKELKNIQVSLDADRDQLTTLEERNATLEREVKRHEERLAIEKNIELLELLLPVKEYSEAKLKYLELKKVRETLHKKVRTLQEANAPVVTFKTALVRQHEDLDRQREQKKTATRRKFTQMQKKWDDNEQLEGEAEEIKTKLDNLKTKEKNRLNDIKKVERHIETAEKELANPPELESLDALNDEIRQIKQESRQVMEKQTDLQNRQKACIEEEARHKASLETARQSLKQLEDHEYRKLDMLRKWDQPCADAVVWLRNNQHRFKMEIMEPPVLTLTVTDKRFTQAIENCFSNNQLKTFVAQCDEDYRLFNRLICDSGEALGRSVRVNTWARARGALVPPPMTPEELKEVEFDGYALDFIKCPDGLKPFLQSELQLHRTAIGLNPRKIDPARAMDMCSRVDPNGGGGGSVRYIIGNTLNNVSRSRYGKRLAQNATYECRQAIRLVNTSVDPEIKQRFEADLRAADQELELIKEQMDKLSVEEAAIRKEGSEFKKRHDELNRRKNHVASEQTRLSRIGIQLKNHRDRLDKLKDAPPVDVERNRYKGKIIELARRRLQIVRDYENLVRGAIVEQTESTKISLQYLQVSANLAHLQELCKVRDEEISEATDIFNKAQQDYERAKDDAGHKLKISKAKLDSVSPETKARFHDVETSAQIDDKSAEEFAEELETEKQKLEMTMHTNASVIEQFNQRKVAIETLKESIEDKEEKVRKKERSIKMARDNWEPALNKLVESVGERFSAAFDRIGCAGEIKISQHEDYDKWAIDILVKFRDNEKLQLLTGERQSGGERSLTTIMYLMSLTEEARTPFSLVDEINQGMDARAERAVHNSLVEVTCKADSGQYFLITPKLLPDLNYHERMKVLCVNNGEWLPEDVAHGDMMNMIDTYVRVSRGGANAAA